MVTPWEEPCYSNGYLFEQSPDVVLMHLALIPGLGAAIGCMGVALPTPLLNIIDCLDLIQGLVDTQVTS